MDKKNLCRTILRTIFICSLTIFAFPTYAYWGSDEYYDNDSDYDYQDEVSYREPARDRSQDYVDRSDANDDSYNDDSSNNGYSRSSAFPQTRRATGNRVFIFNPRAHAWGVYDEKGELVRTGRASGGKKYCPDIGRGCKTIVGTYRIFSKGDASCKSHKFPLPHGGAPMPYCMHFQAKGYAIHGSNSVPNYNASHGCIRVPPSDAAWLNLKFLHVGSTVIVLPY